MFRIVYTEGVAADLKRMRVPTRRRILDTIDEQVSHEPTRPSRNKKILEGLKPPWEHEAPVWELRIGEYRAFYDVDEDGQQVVVRAVRHKPPHLTTEDIL